MTRCNGCVGLLSAAGAGLTLMLACGGSSSSDESNGPAPVPIEKAADEYADVFCDAAVDCCAADGYMLTRATCEMAARDLIDRFLLQPVAGGRVTYDAAAAGRCFAAMRKVTGSCLEPDTTACEQVLQGKVAPGGACNASRECKSPPGGSADCTGDETQAGVCVEQPRVQKGDPCTTTCWEHPDGGRECVAFGDTRGERTLEGTCYKEDGLRCSQASRTCEDLVAVGSSCEGFGDCVAGAFCDATSTCAAKKKQGESCEDFDACVDGLFCKRESFDVPGTCMPELEPGSPCNEQVDECRQGWCENGTCQGGGKLVDPKVCMGDLT